MFITKGYKIVLDLSGIKGTLLCTFKKSNLTLEPVCVSCRGLYLHYIYLICIYLQYFFLFMCMFNLKASEVVPRVNLRYQMDVDKMAEMKSLPGNVSIQWSVQLLIQIHASSFELANY